MKKASLLALSLLFLTILYGCETTKGVGKDLENTGENIQEGIDDLKG